MRVLCVGNMYPPHHLGGLELVWESAVGSLREAGHEVRVLTTDHRQPRVVEDGQTGADVHRDLRWYWRDHAFPRRSPLARWRLERANARTFDRHLSGFRPDVVGWWSMGGMSLSLIARCAQAGVPSAAFVHDDWLVYGPRVDGWTRMFTRRPRLATAARRLTSLPAGFDPSSVALWQFNSEFTRARAREAGWSLRCTEVSPPGIDERFLAPAPERTWDWRLLYVGRLDPRKGIDTAIDALTHLPAQARLTVVGAGSGAEAQRLAALADELGLAERVTLTGPCPREQLPAVYAAADAMVFPVRWAEPWGLVPLEAMGVGRPVVATGRGGSAEYLTNEVNSLLFEADDPAGLAAAVRRLAGDAQLRARVREGGFRTARRFTQARYDAGVEQALERVAGLDGT